MQRSSISVLVVYLGVIGGMLLSTGIALAVVTGTIMQQQHTANRQTTFERQLETAREVREALTKPIPASQPLPRVTTNLRRSLAHVTAPRPVTQRSRAIAMQEARRAFAKVEPAPSVSLFGSLAFGPR